MIKFGEILGNAKVFYRIYPSEYPDWENFKFLQDRKTILVHHVGPRIKEKPGERTYKHFETDGYFYNTPQLEIYTEVMDGVIESVFQGQNAIIAAFGQTGSGKSLTIGGLPYFYQDRGLIPRTIENIFKLKEKLPKNLDMKIQISYIEILSSLKLRDLLRPYPTSVDKNNIHKSLRKLEVRSDLHALQHVFMAEGRKEYTHDVDHSSHAGSSILTFEFTTRNMNFSEPYEFKSKLHLVDLAGNDSFGDKSSSFKNHEQVGTANCIKSFMEQFMLLLSRNDPELVRVKKRTNIISQYLGNALDRSSIYRFIGHLKTSRDDHNLTISLLKFGQLFKTMKPECSSIILKENELMKLAVMEEKLKNLHKERLMLQMLQNQEPKAVCPAIRGHIQRMIDDFVHNQMEGSNLLKMGDIFTILNIMKENILAREEENAIMNKAVVQENKEAKIIEKADLSSIVQPSSSVSKTKQQMMKSSEIGPTQSNSSQPNVSKESSKSGHMKKTPSQIKGHKKESMDPDTRSVSRRGRLSTSSLNGVKRSSTTKKKTGVADSSVSTERTSRKTGNENQQNSSLLSTANLLLPDVIPEYKEALKEYIHCPKSNYKTFLESFKKYENDAKTIYQNYLQELKKLDAYLQILDLRKNEMLQIKLVTQFTRKEVKDNDGCVVKSQLEEKCQENLKKAEGDVASHQEVVLNLQAEFKIALEMRQQIKNEVKEEFDDFCTEKFTIPLQNLEDIKEHVIENETPVDELCEHVKIETAPKEINQETIYEEIYKNLKNLMVNEARKKSRYLIKSIKWLKK